MEFSWTPAYVDAEAIDKVMDISLRAERYQHEKEAKHGVGTLHEGIQAPDDTAKIGDSRSMFWDVLRDYDRETALYLVLRNCLGYSATEVAYGLGVSYARVKYLCAKAREKAARAERAADFAAKAERIKSERA
jgi:DNA-directed RNA polymerase specialized sigma24 family protein